MTKAKTILLWAIRVGLSSLFLVSAIGKFDLGGNMAENFERWGFSILFMVVIGIIEVAGAVALIIPSASFFGSILLAIVMVGSIGTHALHYDEMGFPLLPLVVIFSLLIINFKRFKNTKG